MQHSKLYSSLNYFDKYEQNRLRKYISSPYFYKNEALIILFEILIKHQNRIKDGKNAKGIEDVNIWEKVSPGKAYDDVRFRKLKSELLKLVESFLAQQIYEENPLHQAAYLIEAIGKRKMTNLFKSARSSAKRLSNQQEIRPSNHYYHQYQIEKNIYDISENKTSRLERKNVEEIANNLDYFYLAEKLKYHCFILNQQSIVSHKYKMLFIDEIINHIRKYDYNFIPPIAIYYQLYLTLEESENEEHYLRFKELLNKHNDLFPDDEAQRLYRYGLNISIRNINKGKLSFYKEYFEMFVTILNKGYIFINGELSPLHFTNLIIAALRLKKYDWTKKFIDNYQHRLPENSRENAVSFNKARLLFHLEDYDSVISLLSQIEYDDIFYNLGSKALLIRTYYETDEIDALDSLLESFRTYLSRQDKIPDQRRKNYKDFIKFIRKLSRVIPGDKKSIQKIRAEFDKSEGIVSTDEWLKEKIEALEKGR
ncbi:MAG: hypothetical protein AB8F74_16780 [Saprospiraceae bacterium]